MVTSLDIRLFYSVESMEEFHLSYRSATLMPSNAELKLMTQLLNLPEMKVKNSKLIKQLGVSLYIENEAKAVPCPNCGKTPNKLHPNHRYVARELPIMEQLVYLQVNRRQMRCADCNHK